MTQNNAEIGVILVNLGTPDEPTRSAVSRYLIEFLGDPLVITVPGAIRWFLCRLIALFRSRKSALAYASIWSDAGSPLLVHASSHARSVNRLPGYAGRVRLAMRYGSPSISTAFSELRDIGCKQFIVMPLYPQYARATTLSTLREVDCIRCKQGIPAEAVQWVPPFYHHPNYIQAYAALLKPQLVASEADFVLMSYHGLPVNQVAAPVCEESSCDRQSKPCSAIQEGNKDCYRAQCFSTSRGLAAALHLADEEYGVGFQSRVGRLPWIGPDSVALLDTLYKRGVRRLVVISPAFVADCLETEEELGLAMREQWCLKEGASFHLLPCLNSSTEWVRATVALLETAIPLTWSNKKGELE